MSLIRASEKQQRKLQTILLKEQIVLARLEITKKSAEIELIEEQIKSAKNTRVIMRATAFLTGVSVVATVMNYFGVFGSK